MNLAWIGGKKEVNEKQWTWATGPEKGQPIEDNAESFVRWQSGTLFDSDDEKYLARASWPLDGIQNETEVGTWVAADKYQLPHAWFLVEYSVDEESAKVIPEVEEGRGRDISAEETPEDNEPKAEPKAEPSPN